MFGKVGSYFGQFSASSLRPIKALALQEPSTSRVVPGTYFLTFDTLNALVDFHEGNYHIPVSERSADLAHHVMSADVLGDDTFISFVADTLKVPPTRLLLSHKCQEIRKTIQDRMRTKDAYLSLRETPQGLCYLCKEHIHSGYSCKGVACSTVHAYWMFSRALIVQLLGGAYGVRNVEATPRRKMRESHTLHLSGDAAIEWNVVGWISTPVAR